MTEISAKVVADSRNEFGNRITTMEVVFPRIILAELNTHRMFSRNSASSRAIPFEKMVKSVQENPFIPIAWQKDHKGMQGTEYYTWQPDIDFLTERWLIAKDKAVESAKELGYCGGVSIQSEVVGLTKQLCNRLLEPFMWHKVLITATEWNNFFNLRCPQYHSPVDTHFRHRSKKDCIAAHSNPINLKIFANFTEVDWLKINEGQAEIHMMALAEAIYDAINESTPKQLKAGEWHIPYGDSIQMSILDQHDLAYKFPDIKSLEDLKIRIAVSRCARVSYTTVGEEGKYNYENDIKLYDRLLQSGHYSPFEHVAVSQPDSKNYANFKGFKQIRTILEENK